MAEKQLSFVFDEDRCVQCHACEGACKSWRQTPAGVKWRWVRNLWTGRYPDVSGSTATIACQHCADPACLAACPVGAITKDEATGVVRVDAGACIGCRACLRACPFGVPQFGEDGVMQKCDLCGAQSAADRPPCVRTCPTGALELVWRDAAQKRTAEQKLAERLRI